MKAKWTAPTKYIVAVGFAVGGVLMLYVSRSVLPVIIFAMIIAFLTNPIVRFLTMLPRFRFPRWLAVMVAYVLLVVILALFPILVTPMAIDAVRAINTNAFVEWLQVQLDNGEAWLLSMRVREIFGYTISFEPVIDPVLDMYSGTATRELPSFERLLNLLPTAFSSVTDVAGFLASTISNLALTVLLTAITSIYLSMGAPNLYRSAVDMAPELYREEFVILVEKVTHVWSAFFRGQITVSLILTIITWLGAMAIGLPGAFILGITAGILALIPTLGPVIAVVPALIVALVQGTSAAYLPVTNSTFVLIVLVMYLVIQQLEGNLITPRIVGQAIDLPPVVVLLGVVVGTSAAGLLGTVLAAPTLATLKVLGIYAWNKLWDREPFDKLEPKLIEPVQPSQLVESVRATGQHLQERYQQLSTTFLTGPDKDEEE